MNRLKKSRTNRVMDGVLGGIGEYFNIDPVIIRILYVIFTLTTAFFGGIILYIIAMVIIPEGDYKSSSTQWSDSSTHSDTSWSEQRSSSTKSEWSSTKSSRNGGVIVGIILIMLGGLFLINNILDYSLMYYVRKYGEYFWGIALIAVGLFVIIMGGKKR